MGFSLAALMDEVEALVRTLLGAGAAARAAERAHLPRGVPARARAGSVHGGGPRSWRAPPRAAGFTGSARDARDELLELLMGAVIGPRSGASALTFIYGYPASQAALARLDPHDPRTALRFELYGEGIELANGFHELAAAAEQRARFEQDQRRAAAPGPAGASRSTSACWPRSSRPARMRRRRAGLRPHADAGRRRCAYR